MICQGCWTRRYWVNMNDASYLDRNALLYVLYYLHLAASNFNSVELCFFSTHSKNINVKQWA
jgi:hypothetical protein